MSITEGINEGVLNDIDYFGKDNNSNKDIITMLLLGIDDNNFEGSRTDSMVLSIINKNDKKISLLSIPRDLKVKIHGTESYNKINSAFSSGGIDLTAATVEDHFGIPIDHYAVINFNGFSDLVDAIGGLEVDVEKSLQFKDRITNQYFSLTEGKQKLNGIQTLNYSRFRGDGEGDYGRMRRQQQVIKELLNQTLSFRNVPKVTSIYKAVESNLETNIPLKEVTFLALNLRNINGEHIDNIEFSTNPIYFNGASYVDSTEDELFRLKEELSELTQ